MKIGQLNIRSIYNKKEELKDVIRNHNLDIICLQETWIKEDNFNLMQSYKCFHRNRADGYGGVAIMVKNKISTNEILFIDLTNIEIIGVEVKVKHKKENKMYNIINIYIKPNITDGELSEDLDRIGTKLNNIENLIICGDINLAHNMWDNKCKGNSKKADTFVEFINNNSLITLNTGEPTHLHDTNSRAIDISISTINLFDQFNWSISDDNCNSDHLLIIIEYIETVKNRASKNITNYKKVTRELCEMDHEMINNIRNLKQLNNILEETIIKNTRQIKIDMSRRKPW